MQESSAHVRPRRALLLRPTWPSHGPQTRTISTRIAMDPRLLQKKSETDGECKAAKSFKKGNYKLSSNMCEEKYFASKNIVKNILITLRNPKISAPGVRTFAIENSGASN